MSERKDLIAKFSAEVWRIAFRHRERARCSINDLDTAQETLAEQRRENFRALSTDARPKICPPGVVGGKVARGVPIDAACTAARRNRTVTGAAPTGATIA